MLTYSMKKTIDQGLSSCSLGSIINYFGMSHLRLVCDGKIIGIVSLEKTDLSEIADYLSTQGFKLGKEIDPSSVQSVPNNGLGWK